MKNTINRTGKRMSISRHLENFYTPEKNTRKLSVFVKLIHILWELS